MTADEFFARAAPGSVSPALQALWHDARGDWTRAHEWAQEASSADGDWVHAYLHRKEGDVGNAQYWYARAHRKMPGASLDDERRAIAEALLAKSK